MTRPVAKLLTGFVIAAFLLVVTALLFTLNQPPPAPPPLPKPNGYDDLMRAGSMLADNTGEFATMGEGDLRALVETNGGRAELGQDGVKSALSGVAGFFRT